MAAKSTREAKTNPPASAAAAGKGAAGKDLSKRAGGANASSPPAKGKAARARDT